MSLEYFPESVIGCIYLNDNPGLGYLQEIKNFNQLHQAHVEIIKIKEEKERLQQTIQIDQTSNYPQKTNKI